MITDKNQQLVWRADQKPFGETTVTVDKTDSPLRFPGQYYDGETGLHYNYFRDYDPATGRYLESDPIGLQSGLNTYAYVSSNPLNRTDPYGLVESWWNSVYPADFNIQSTYSWTPRPPQTPARGFSPGAYDSDKIRPSNYESCRPDRPCETSFSECMEKCISFFNPVWSFYASTGVGFASSYGKGGMAAGANTAARVWGLYGGWVGLMCPRACHSDACSFDGS